MENTFTPLKDTLASQGKSFSQENLNALAKTAGIENYKSTNDQNKQLAQMLQKTTPASNATVSNANVSPIALNQLNTQAVDIPQPAPVSTQTAPVAPQNFANDFLQQTQVEDTQAQKSASNLSLAISSLIPELQGQAEATAQAEKVAGVDRYRQELQGINNQILMKTAEINQDDIRLAQSLQNIEDKPIAMEFITGQQSSVQRNAQLARALKQADIGILNARAIGTQGNVQLAVDTAKQAVDLKYAPMKETIATYEAQLKALEPILNADEKKQARAQEVKTKLALNELEQKQAGEKALQEIIINASSQGAPASLVSRAEKAKTPAQAAMILGQYAGDYYKTELLKSQIKTDAAQRANYNANAAKTNAERISAQRASLSDAGGQQILFGGIQTPQDLQNATTKLKLTEGQGKSLAFAQRAINADKALQERLKTYDPTTAISALGRGASTDNARAYQRDLSDFITAVLRKESGATITPDEFALFTPLYSSQGVMTNKNDTLQTNIKRQGAIDALISEAGPAAPALSSYKQNNTISVEPAIVESKNPALNTWFKNTVSSVKNIQSAVPTATSYGFTDNQN